MQQASWGQTEIGVSLSAQPLVSGSPCRWSTAIDAAAVQIARSHVATELPKAFLISMQRKLVESNANANARQWEPNRFVDFCRPQAKELQKTTSKPQPLH